MSKPIRFVGLDVHSQTIAIVELPSAGQDSVPPRDIPTDPTSIRRTFSRMKKRAQVRCCYEAGPCGFDLYRQLTDMGISCEVIAPALIPRKPGDRIKTDHRDAKKLAHLYRAGELTPIRVPTPEEEAVRDVIRARDDVRKDLVAARHRLAKFLLRRGRIYTQGSKWTQRFWRWLRGLEAFQNPVDRTTFEHYVLQVHHLIERKAALEKEILSLAETDPYRELANRLSCLRGISTLSAMTLLAEIQDFRRFKSPRDFMSFVGLVPSEYSSGNTRKRGRITKTGNTHARRTLIEAAWAYQRYASVIPSVNKLLSDQPPEVSIHVKKAQNRLHRRYRRLLGRGKRSQLAVTAVARELCGFIWALMVKEAA
jgi:transposase